MSTVAFDPGVAVILTAPPGRGVLPLPVPPMTNLPPDHPYGYSLHDAAIRAGVPFREFVEPTDRTYESEGLRLHYLDWGNEHLPALILLHGFAQQAHSWDFAALALRDRYHVVAVSLRGHGDSDWSPDGRYLPYDQLRDLDRLVDDLQIRSYAVCGLSLGGRVALLHGLSHPPGLRSLIVVDVGPEVTRAGTGRIRAFVERKTVWDSFEAMAEDVAHYTRRRRPIEQVRGSLHHAARELPDGRWTWKYDPKLRQRLASGPPPATPSLWERLHSLTCPTLLVRGGESDILAADVADRMRRTIPDCEYAEIPGAGHLVPGDNPVAFIEVVRPFLERTVPD